MPKTEISYKLNLKNIKDTVISSLKTQTKGGDDMFSIHNIEPIKNCTSYEYIPKCKECIGLLEEYSTEKEGQQFLCSRNVFERIVLIIPKKKEAS